MPADRGVPLACSLDASDASRRRERWLALAERALIGAERTPAGARHTYRAERSVERELRELIELEAECCPFLEFELSSSDGALLLDIRGPAEAAEIIELFAGTGLGAQ